jgi:diadenylate cyclase
VTQFSAAWPHVSVISIVDILLVAIIIYQFLALVKGTRASLMLVGAAGLGLAFWLVDNALPGLHLSRLGNLAALNWLITTLLPYTVFALIVVFAAEIRQALARLGRGLTLSRTAGSEADAYDDIVLAANLFCQNQTGALIVIEREIGLRTYIESGVPLDARLSYDLLATIFRPSAPLHDGAVIVQNDRIAAAACFLPLSMNPVLSTQLGTRHRAGIGVTEETDAIAVIVSEETGSISLAVSGKIERDLSVEQLRDRLGELLRRYLPPSTLPTPISNGTEVSQASELESSRPSLPRAADSRLTADGRLNDAPLKQGTDR